MRDWSLGLRDPLCLTLAADARLCKPDYTDDQIWEAEFSSGDPAALSFRTTYGLRARSMRIFPRFMENGATRVDPAAFSEPPTLLRFYANFLRLKFAPFENLETLLEVWVPNSHELAGRITLINHTTAQRNLRMEWSGQLSPLEGRPLAPVQMGGAHVLAGETSGLFPVIFLTGGAAPGEGATPSLGLEISLGPGARRQFTWAHAALDEVQASFEAARHAVARPWEAERARIELLNESQTVEIHTGDDAWDSALAFSQQAAFRLFFPGSESLPHPAPVQTRQMNHGYSLKGDGSDYPPAWSGYTALDAYYLASVLPGAPKLARHLLENFLDIQTSEGEIDFRPGLAGQRGNFLAAPFLASLAWEIYEREGDESFLEAVFPKLHAFFWSWFTPEQDRNRDSLPEWAHPSQSNFEDSLIFNAWHPWAQGAEISTALSPSLLAALYREAKVLLRMAERLRRRGEISMLKIQSDALLNGTQSCWDARRALYRYRDRDTRQTPRGKILAQNKGGGEIRIKQQFDPPVRLLIEVQRRGETARRPEVHLREYVTKKGEDETLSPQDFRWKSGGKSAVATSKKVFSRVGKVIVKGLNPEDKVIVRTLNLIPEDHTLLLPLWAGIPSPQQAQAMIGRALLNAERFDHPYGVPACPSSPNKDAEPICLSVHFPWNQLIAEGLLAFGFREEAARLTVHLIAAAIQNLRQNRAFYQYYHADVGTGIGERNALTGLAPVGLFLKVLGVQILSPTRVRLEGQNPFGWTVTVKYRGLSITREAERTEIIFPNGQRVVVTDEVPCTVSL